MEDKQNTEFNLEDALTKLVWMRDEASPMLDALKELEQAIRTHVIETGEIIDLRDSQGVRVSITVPKESISIDTKRLKKDMKDDSELRAILEPYIEVKKKSPYSVIKFGN